MQKGAEKQPPLYEQEQAEERGRAVTHPHTPTSPLTHTRGLGANTGGIVVLGISGLFLPAIWGCGNELACIQMPADDHNCT